MEYQTGLSSNGLSFLVVHVLDRTFQELYKLTFTEIEAVVLILRPPKNIRFPIGSSHKTAPALAC